MAIFVEGMDCVLCGKAMVMSESIRSFPPLTANRSDPIFVVSDAAVHEACFLRFPHARAVEALLARLTDGGSSGRH